MFGWLWCCSAENAPFLILKMAAKDIYEYVRKNEIFSKIELEARTWNIFWKELIDNEGRAHGFQDRKNVNI